MKTAFRQNVGVPFKLCLSQNCQIHQTGSHEIAKSVHNSVEEPRI